MPTPKNGFRILNIHKKTKQVFQKITLFFNVLLPKFYEKVHFEIEETG